MDFSPSLVGARTRHLRHGPELALSTINTRQSAPVRNENSTHFPTQEYILWLQPYPTAHRWLVERLGAVEVAAAGVEADVVAGLADVVDLPRQ